MAGNKMSIRLAQRYYRSVGKLIDEDTKATRKAFQDEIVPRIYMQNRMKANRSGLVNNDAMDEIVLILARLRQSANDAIYNQARVEQLASTFVMGVNRRQMQAFASTISRVAGFDPTRSEPWLRSFLRTAIAENVSYIKTIPIEYHNRVDTIVNQGVRRGLSIADMGQAIAREGRVSLARGEFIARDQLGSIHGDLTKARQQNMGLTSFKWVTASDERVRDSHAAMDGKVYTWQDGAVNERGEQVWPGTDYNCRCYAEPLEEELRTMAINRRGVGCRIIPPSNA